MRISDWSSDVCSSDLYTRASGKMAMAIAQNGPGVTGFVTAVKTAYWNHTPMLLVTPQAANRTIGQGGFQEVDQMRSEEHTSELQSLMRISYAVFCLKKKK